MRTVGSALLVAAALAFAVPVCSSASAATIQPAESGAQFYLRWRTAVLNAKSPDEIAPFFNADTKEEFSMATPADRADMLAMMKRSLGMQTGVTVVKETPTPSGASLALEALNADKKPVVGSVEILKENGAWKVTNAVERWKPKG